MADVLAPTGTGEAALGSAPPAVEQLQLSPETSADAQCSLVPNADSSSKPGEGPEPEPVSRGIYFVRCPRPELGATEKNREKLDGQLGECFNRLKALNTKFNVKKGEANELRKQLSVARSLRNGSSPDFDEKMSRLKQLRDLRKGYLDKISDFKSGRAGLECRTEEELDDKIAEIEHSIQHEGLTLQDEKAKVKQIAKLKSQRDKIREFQGAQEGSAQLEAEAKKLKAVIDEVEGEVNILRGERNEAKDIIDDLTKKLAGVTAVLDEYQLERQDIESTKRELQDALKALRDETDAAMFEYRANRKLGLQIRDLVAEGRLLEAKEVAAQQVDTYMAKLQSDKRYRQEYIRAWKDQRRYLVSELLPDSGNVQGGAGDAAAGGRGGAGGKGGRGGAAAGGRPAAPLVPQGKAKAEALIAAALQEADVAIAAKRLAEPHRQPEPEPEPSSEEAGGEDGGEDGGAAAAADSGVPRPPVRRIVPGASEELTAPRKPKASKTAAAKQHKAEVPDIPEYEYELPTESAAGGGGAAQQQQLSAEQQKAKLREQQRRLAEEAEERKKRRQEQQAKKAAQRQKAAADAADAAAKAAKPASRAAAALAAVAADAEAAAAAAGATDTDADECGALSGGEGGGGGAVVQQRRRGGGGGGGGGGKAGGASASAAAARKVPFKKAPKPAKKWYEEHSTPLTVLVVLALLLAVLAMAVTTPK